MLIENISVVIIAKNAEKTIDSCLNSLSQFKEVILYLNNSTDNTMEIAKTYKNVKILYGTFDGFGPTKNRAVSFSSNNWILSLDSDEVLSKEFVNSVSTLLLDEHLYSILRVNYYKEKKIKYCWKNDIIVRIYNRETTSFCDNQVHEYVMEKNHKVVLLRGIIEHYPYNNIDDFMIKAQRYSSLFAKENVGKKNSSPTKAFFNAQFSFIKTYFLRRGFLDGYAGLLISFSHMTTNFYKYMKLYEANQKLDK